MKVLGLVFVGSRSPDAERTAAFARDVLGLTPRTDPGSDAVFFDLPDGGTFAVQHDDVAERTVGFLVDDVRAAVAELQTAGVETDGVAQVAGLSYAHFRAPDGRLYELVERLPVDAGEQPGQDRGTT